MRIGRRAGTLAVTLVAVGVATCLAVSVLAFQKNGEDVVEAYQPVAGFVDFEALRAINPDVIAWIEVPGTSVSQPVVAAPDGDSGYYLNHALDRSHHYAGVPYLDSSCSGGILDSSVSLVYGHHLVDGSVFSELSSYSDPAFLDSHRTVNVYVPGHIATYDVVACRVVDAAREGAVLSHGTTAEMRRWLADTLGVHRPTNRLLELVTCSYSTYANERTVVYAVPSSFDGTRLETIGDMNEHLGDVTS